MSISHSPQFCTETEPKTGTRHLSSQNCLWKIWIFLQQASRSDTKYGHQHQKSAQSSLLWEMSGFKVLLKGTTAVTWSSRVNYSSTFLQLPSQFWQSDHKLAFTTAMLLPPQVWYELDWNIKKSVCLYGVFQPSRSTSSLTKWLSYYWLNLGRTKVQVPGGGMQGIWLWLKQG